MTDEEFLSAVAKEVKRARKLFPDNKCTKYVPLVDPAPSPEELAEDDLQFIAEAEEIVARTIRDRRDANRFNRLDYRRAHLLLRLHNSALRSHQAPSRDAGWVMVPREPTAQMLAAMATVYDAGWNYPQPQKVELDWAEKSYAAMLTAAPGAGKGER